MLPGRLAAYILTAPVLCGLCLLPRLAHPAGIEASFAMPSEHPVPNHVVLFACRFRRHFSACNREAVPGFATIQLARHITPPPAFAGAGCTGSLSYGLFIRRRLLSTPPHVMPEACFQHDAVTLGYTGRDLLWTGLAPA